MDLFSNDIRPVVQIQDFANLCLLYLSWVQIRVFSRLPCFQILGSSVPPSHLKLVWKFFCGGNGQRYLYLEQGLLPFPKWSKWFLFCYIKICTCANEMLVCHVKLVIYSFKQCLCSSDDFLPCCNYVLHNGVFIKNVAGLLIWTSIPLIFSNMFELFRWDIGSLPNPKFDHPWSAVCDFILYIHS